MKKYSNMQCGTTTISTLAAALVHKYIKWQKSAQFERGFSLAKHDTL